MAEREGFEPSVHLLSVHTISSRAPSANSDISPHKSSIVFCSNNPWADFNGGEGGIRTPGPDFSGQLISNQPPSTKLGHLSPMSFSPIRVSQKDIKIISLWRYAALSSIVPSLLEKQPDNVLTLFCQYTGRYLYPVVKSRIFGDIIQ